MSLIHLDEKFIQEYDKFKIEDIKPYYFNLLHF
jgi:hypothetical protein